MGYSKERLKERMKSLSIPSVVNLSAPDAKEH